MIEMMSKTGSYHSKNHTENQDVILSGSSGSLTGLFLADGVSGCERSGVGAMRVCEAMKNLLMKRGACFFDLEEREIADYSLAHVRYALRELSRLEGRPVEHFSSTMAWGLLDRRSGRLMLLNLGDGLIAGVRDGRLNILAMPDDSSKGCCCTTTEGAEGRTAVRFADAGDYDEVFLCSDGAWKALFDGGRLRDEVRRLLKTGACADLANYLRKTDTFDDCSFISMKCKENGGPSDERASVLK